MKHEVWIEDEGETEVITLCLFGTNGKEELSPNAKLIWTFEANSYFEAMTKYYEYMGWEEYKCFDEKDKKPFK